MTAPPRRERETRQERPTLFGFGLAGLAGALLAELGEGVIQLVPDGTFADPAYGYFTAVSPERLAIGHWIAVSAAPLYLAGYWHLTGRLFPDGGRLRTAVFAGMAWAFILAIVWIGQRALLAQTVQAVADGSATADLLAAQARLHEPLVRALRIAIAAFSLLWIIRILAGDTDYPHWMAAFSPGLLLGLIFALYLAAPGIGWLVLPTAMNTAHAVLFTLSLATSRALSTSRAATLP